MSEPELRYSPVDGMQVHETDDGLIVFDPETDRVHHLNFTAGALYTLCSRGSRRDELAERFARLFELDETSASDVDDCLEQLVKDGLLTTECD